GGAGRPGGAEQREHQQHGEQAWGKRHGRLRAGHGHLRCKRHAVATRGHAAGRAAGTGFAGTRPGRIRRLKFPRAAADTAGMSHNLLDRIDQRTRLAGHNRLALLLFRLGGRQLFGVNVFKVREVLRRPGLFQVPGVPKQFVGVADVRGRSVPVLDLGVAIHHPERDASDLPGYLVVTEFNRSVQGYLVSEVERIVNIAVEEIHPPPDSGGANTYLTAVTRYGGELIQVIDVESVLADISQARMDAELPPEYALPADAPP